MRLDIDTYREIADSLVRNKSRSLLTGFGVFWGIFMLLFLMGGGQGLKQVISSNFEGFATNTAIIPSHGKGSRRDAPGTLLSQMWTGSNIWSRSLRPSPR